MSKLDQRLERAIQARDERLALAWLEANPPVPCPGCGRPTSTRIPGTGTGRWRIYCSNACRQRAYRSRRSHTEGSSPPPPESSAEPAPQVPATSIPKHDLDACIIAVLEQPTAIASVLDVVRRASCDGVLDQTKFAEVKIALVALTAGQDRDSD